MNPFSLKNRVNKLHSSTLRSTQIASKRKHFVKRDEPENLDNFLILDGFEGLLLQEDGFYLVLDK